MMARLSVLAPGALAARQARKRIVRLSMAGLFAALLALWFASPTAAQEESAACEQYGCAQEAPPAEEGILTPDPPAPPVGSSPPVEEEVSSEEEIDDPSETTDAETPPEDSAAGGDGTDGDGSTTGLPAEEEPSAYGRPLPLYPYAGEPCEDRYCGMEGVEAPVECAVYETDSGKEVYGCADPRTYDREGCYEVTFYTETGEPYSNLDTCSGEKPYAPPEPPEGRFRYWDPPDEPGTYASASWDGHLHSRCISGRGRVWDPHCGLEDIPERYACQVYYDTVYGTVRGCWDQRSMLNNGHDFFCDDAELHLYDEAGREIDTVDDCPKIRTRDCGRDQCSAPAPHDWSCRREEWNFGELYNGERRTMTRCASPEFDEYIGGEQPSCKRKDAGLIAALYDEHGRSVDAIPCIGGRSDWDLGAWAGMNAGKAEDTLDEGGGGSGGGDETGGSTGGSGSGSGGPLASVSTSLYSLLNGGDEDAVANPLPFAEASPKIASVEDFTGGRTPVGTAATDGDPPAGPGDGGGPVDPSGIVRGEDGAGGQDGAGTASDGSDGAPPAEQTPDVGDGDAFGDAFGGAFGEARGEGAGRGDQEGGVGASSSAPHGFEEAAGGALRGLLGRAEAAVAPVAQGVTEGGVGRAVLLLVSLGAGGTALVLRTRFLG